MLQKLVSTILRATVVFDFKQQIFFLLKKFQFHMRIKLTKYLIKILGNKCGIETLKFLKAITYSSISHHHQWQHYSFTFTFTFSWFVICIQMAVFLLMDGFSLLLFFPLFPLGFLCEKYFFLVACFVGFLKNFYFFFIMLPQNVA